jgi:hypothetical protein
MTNNVIEIVNFKLASGISAQTLTEANNAFQVFIDQQPGVLYRSFAKQANSDLYIDVVYFASLEDAQRVEQAFHETPVCQQFASLIEKDSVILERYHTLSQTPCNAE